MMEPFSFAVVVVVSDYVKPVDIWTRDVSISDKDFTLQTWARCKGIVVPCLPIRLT